MLGKSHPQSMRKTLFPLSGSVPGPAKAWGSGMVVYHRWWVTEAKPWGMGCMEGLGISPAMGMSWVRAQWQGPKQVPKIPPASNGSPYVWGWMREEAGASLLKGQRDFVFAVAEAFLHGHTGPCRRW